MRGAHDRARRRVSVLRPPMRSMMRSCRKRSSLTCNGSGMSPTSSRNKRAAIGQFDLALGGFDRSGEGALFMTEQFGFEQIFRDRTAVDRNEGFRRRGRSHRAARGPAIPYRSRWRPAA